MNHLHFTYNMIHSNKNFISYVKMLSFLYVIEGACTNRRFSSFLEILFFKSSYRQDYEMHDCPILAIIECTM